MKLTTQLVAGACIALSVASGAYAAEGCGRGFHRGPAGACRPNAGPGRGPVVVAPAPQVGIFYGGRGWWDGNRYWGHRYRYRGGWRYR